MIEKSSGFCFSVQTFNLMGNYRLRAKWALDFISDTHATQHARERGDLVSPLLASRNMYMLPARDCHLFMYMLKANPHWHRLISLQAKSTAKDVTQSTMDLKVTDMAAEQGPLRAHSDNTPNVAPLFWTHLLKTFVSVSFNWQGFRKRFVGLEKRNLISF